MEKGIINKMRFFFFLFFANITISLFSQGIDIVGRLWGDCKKPNMIKLEINPPLSNNYLDDVKEIIINCGDDVKIIIHPSMNEKNQLIEITKNNKVLYKFYSEGVFNHFYLSGAYRIGLFPNKTSSILLVAYPTGATGISANMTWGLLINIENGMYQKLSTWGLLNECFIDIDDNANFEFICVEYQQIGYNEGLVANIFSPDIFGKYIVNTSSKTNNVFVLFFDDKPDKLPIKKLNWKQSLVELLRLPDVFLGTDNYIKK